MFDSCRRRLFSILLVSAAPISFLGLLTRGAPAQVLVGNPFIHNYTGWVDAFPPPVRQGNWRLSLHNPTLMDTNNANPPTPDSLEIRNTGIYEPDVLIQNNFLAPATYDLNVAMRTNDDDLFGVVWNYQDPNNYFRLGLRQQTANSGNFGGTQGLSVQKIVNGVVTQLFPASGTPGPDAVTLPMIDNREPINVKVAVNGSNLEVFFNGTSYFSGSDPDLASGRKVGVQSWAQQARSTNITPFWGTEVESLSVTQGANTLYNQSFAGRPVQFRQLVMRNQNGVSGLDTGVAKDVLGNFGLSIDHPWVYQHSNGFVNATFGNADFIGPAVVVDTPGATAMTNYQMQVRLGASDNDGMGVLFRVQDDNNFYRLTFVNEQEAAGNTTRAPRGMSIQKVRNGVWSEVFRDPTTFVPAVGTDANPISPITGLPMHDVTVGVVGNSIKVQVRDNLGNVHNYPIIVDNSDPILNGSVGFHTWGNVHTYYMGYGGLDVPLVTALAAFTDFDVVVDRATGNIRLTNNGSAPVNIKGISILSAGGGLNPANWLSIANNYDRPSPPTPGNGSVDPDDAWTITSSTSTELSEREPTGNGGTLAVGQSVNFGNAWVKSRVEDTILQIELAGGSLANAAVSYSGTPWHRSDLNTDGFINASDWALFFPNMLANLSSMTAVQRALVGDVNGDGIIDVTDFTLFKGDFEQFNGAGSFDAMLAGVPEPTTLLMLAISGIALMVCRRRPARAAAPGAAAVLIAAVLASTANAAAVDFTTYTVEAFPPANRPLFQDPIWTITPTTATHPNNADASVVYSPGSALNKRFIGTLTPGTDDDVVGFVLGFNPGDAQIFSSADYLLIDWKGVTQTNFNFVDSDFFNFHHDQTPGGDMPVGLALSRVTGSPTGDELWQHQNLPENPSGGVTELARGTTLGSAPYNRAGGSHLFDIRYSATNVTVLVDGVEQFNVNGSFPNGRFGLYSAWQGPPAIFSNFEELDIGFAGLTATVDRSNGNITVQNAGTAAVEFDFYQFNSATNSLNTSGWNSLHDQNFQAIGAGPGQRWQEAGGSSAAAIAEVYLQSHSTLAGGASINLGSAYNNGINGEDLVFQFRLPGSGLILNGTVNYVGTAPGLQGDFNGDGKVDAADYVIWRKTDGSPAGYNLWRANFGNSTPGAGSGLGATSGVPEPGTGTLALLCLAILGAQFGRRIK